MESMVNIYMIFRPINLSPYIEGLIQNAGGVLRFNYMYLGGEFLGLVPHLGGAVSFVPREVYDGFKWPNVAFLHGGNDVLLSSYLTKNGYLLAYMENYKSEHEPKQTKKYPKYFKRRKRETITRTTEYLKTGKLRTNRKMKIQV